MYRAVYPVSVQLAGTIAVDLSDPLLQDPPLPLGAEPLADGESLLDTESLTDVEPLALDGLLVEPDDRGPPHVHSLKSKTFQKSPGPCA